MNLDPKPWWLSKSIFGSVVTTMSIASTWCFGVQVDAATQAVIVDQIVALTAASTALIGTALSIYGRIVARQPIG